MRHILMLSFSLLFSIFAFADAQGDKNLKACEKQMETKCNRDPGCILKECQNTLKLYTFKIEDIFLTAQSKAGCKFGENAAKRFDFRECTPDSGKVTKYCYDRNIRMVESIVAESCRKYRESAGLPQNPSAVSDVKNESQPSSSSTKSPTENVAQDSLSQLPSRTLNQPKNDGQHTSRTTTSINASASTAKVDNAESSKNSSATQASSPSNSSVSNSANSSNSSTNSDTIIDSRTGEHIDKETGLYKPSTSGYDDSKLDNLHVETVETKSLIDNKDPKVSITAGLEQQKQELPKAVSELPVIKEAAVKSMEAPKDPSEAKVDSKKIQSAAEARSPELQQVIKAIDSTTSGLQSSVPGVVFTNTVATLNELKELILTYDKQKDSCAAAADRAELLCIESKSPGVQAAKTVLDLAGPALGTINSVQKSCSSTAKVTKFVGAGIMVAKGVCIASKIACDTRCVQANATLAKIKLYITARYGKSIAVDQSNITVNCINYKTTLQCKPEMASKMEVTDNFVGISHGVFKKEDVGTPGTAPEVALKCQQHAKDIIAFTTNIMGLFQASKTAQECADKTGTSKVAVTPAQYCEKPENKSTQFCKCQFDNSAEGCPGHISANLTTPNSTTDENGANVKGQGGQSQFAGGMKPIKPDSVNLGGLNSDGTAAQGNGEMAGTGTGGSGGFAGSAGGGVGAASGSKSGETVEANEANTVEPEKKKFSFGALFGLGGGSSSVGRGSSNRGASEGGLGVKDMSAIQRKIASEQLRTQISGASGKSNWEKVSDRYSKNKSTFLLGQ